MADTSDSARHNFDETREHSAVDPLALPADETMDKDQLNQQHQSTSDMATSSSSEDVHMTDTSDSVRHNFDEMKKRF